MSRGTLRGAAAPPVASHDGSSVDEGISVSQIQTLSLVFCPPRTQPSGRPTAWDAPGSALPRSVLEIGVPARVVIWGWIFVIFRKTIKVTGVGRGSDLKTDIRRSLHSPRIRR